MCLQRSGSGPRATDDMAQQYSFNFRFEENLIFDFSTKDYDKIVKVISPQFLTENKIILIPYLLNVSTFKKTQFSKN